VKVQLAERIGFCFGVKRAVRMAEAALKKNKKIYSLGSIIHNEQVVEDLAKRGLKVIKDVSAVSGPGAVVVVSSHGIGPKVARRIRQRGIRVIDTTCPFVLNAQRIAQHLAREGYSAMIVGDSKHPEVKALVDFAPKGAVVVKDRAEAAALKPGKNARISVLSQTTQSQANFLDVVKTILEKRPKELKVCNTICNDAEERQRLASELASRVGLMLVIGGRHSANTRRLYEVCRKTLKNTHLIETEKELRRAWFSKVGSVGIASGASTPDWVVQQVVKSVKILKKGVV
jgi:4-hydroxy-3-methylbut-2-en-1-yl diphosphate reductase